ncbi:molybdopterin converting factor small subunit [Chryseobacterium sediminis]|uniref:Molybdopterin converting factor small subunit n=1 Tax=Chryseobacterium sediminis TaxID=1679494 RepID=A0ABR6PZQ1_9FLAO|nr:MoaD/ThiS family protein [Chryseobacterium sediminis]MBB6330916.1 molybdopterin converting factor small subunit [Chryseobacterium sediminis]
MTLKIFGKLTDIFKKDQYDLDTENISNVSDLKKVLNEKFPALKDLTFLIVVNGVKAEDSEPISGDAEIALLPPYSGG